ncbi:TPA: cyclopropane fatty acyl phospholipid synthase [Stenotrophomonas maltophilia]|jgi:cyclopropane-fatty-acyl-phospholipid synthase|uniref:Cyclopropane fatty acyl phospholipid synthase n=2 Tax=Stenotrophomonas TaxID=40323 RepID=A0A2J0SUF3_STEMA|nr:MULTISPECIES: cyclopropane fatty acyl phospholipid synthase [Stenotrophomonas]AVO30422.1 cyclopropane-fatty-acyl-phospholipid synthase [Stenotrophomonas maltophilia]EKT4443436.1 cyclopropane fatty acyl phospholipid synthase [Stenotrophomonas maltophilia]ELF4102105.1 cyclopropane fatty acyl phospholipid synthase [Stenotrophomonas maltophilia]EMF60749.1 Cyclopropane-fatty-acyl-phospholipid synthase [Stenotrophomonas maltophilia EPM1]KWV48659.1 cyclopropane fatty acyl phospholipid synthase [St
MTEASTKHKSTETINRNHLHRMMDELLEIADVRLGGDRPWDIRLLVDGVPERVFAQGNLGLGESYMNGAWECDRLDELFDRILRARLDRHVKPLRLMFHSLRAKLLNRQTSRQAWEVGEAHYDLGNDFYTAMLDPRMTYTCGYWADAKNLAEAQEAKLDMICHKLRLEPGMRVLDIGCGWGSFMAYAAEHYGVECVGVTVSKEQTAWATERYADLPLEFRLQDYRSINERFDRIASVGMFEHVGRKNHRSYMEVAHRCLADDGLFLLHTIGKNRRKSTTDPWIDRYIFPNGELPSIGQIGDACDELFVVEDLHNFGADYDNTLMAWHANFEQAWPHFEDELGQRFHRMWRYYLLSCAGAFRARDLQLWQWVLSKDGVRGGYQRPEGPR